MRVRIDGDGLSVPVLRGLLSRAEIRVVSVLPTLDITIVEGNTPFIIVDGVDGELERLVVEHICNTAPGVYLAREGGVRSATALRITSPSNEDARHAIELGCLRGILAYVSKTPWWKIW